MVLAGEVVSIQYFHLPVSVPIGNLFDGIICVFTEYRDAERRYLEVIGGAMGATIDRQYRQGRFPVLICPAASGPKYEAALRWEFPVVSSSWLTDSHKQS